MAYSLEIALDETFAALADASRRTIVRRLAQHGVLSVGEASEGLALSPAGVTKHVQVLERAGLVTRRLAGRRHELSLEAERLLLAEDWIERYRQLWTTSATRLSQLAAALEAEPDKGDMQ